ncbi:hypothetical protein [Sorangium sp. So ce590]|uniref:hypothetical protein n=1 Tax=unclassified Sorangium TaxID=2621164 RepID=UPI003F6018B3
MPCAWQASRQRAALRCDYAGKIIEQFSSVASPGLVIDPDPRDEEPPRMMACSGEREEKPQDKL